MHRKYDDARVVADELRDIFRNLTASSSQKIVLLCEVYGQLYELVKLMESKYSQAMVGHEETIAELRRQLRDSSCERVMRRDVE